MLSPAAEGARRSPNNFGALRLLFAVLVILSHSPELVDGNRSREILTRIFGTLSFGEFGVDGFFLISGYLITKSFQDSGSAGGYLLKRVLRIYPGYVVAYLLCIFALGPFVGGQIAELSGARVLREIISLSKPGMQGVFPGMPYPSLNSSMWTIAYEFRCYLLVLAAGTRWPAIKTVDPGRSGRWLACPVHDGPAHLGLVSCWSEDIRGRARKTF